MASETRRMLVAKDEGGEASIPSAATLEHPTCTAHHTITTRHQPPATATQSARRATLGSTCVARSPGTRLASTATARSVTAATVYVIGSLGDTLYSSGPMNRL